MKRAIVFALLLSILSASAESIDKIANEYLDAYFAMYPTRATAAGRHDFDQKLEDLSAEKLSRWIEFNRNTRATIADSDSLDAEALRGQIDRELNALTNLKRAECDPLYWSSVIGDATVFLLVRDDLSLAKRQQRARARARLLPAFANAAREHFQHVDLAQVAPEFCNIAANQVRASAKFYAEGFSSAVDDRDIGPVAAAALNEFAQTLEDIAKRATGSPRLGNKYAETFRIGTGVNESVADVLKRAVVDLAATRAEAAKFGRTIWHDVIGSESPPNDDAQLVRRLFDRIGEDRDRDANEALAHWRENVNAINTLVHEKKIMTLPDPLTLIVDLSPSFFVGQSVGGVYPPGPYASEAKTILFIPTPPNDATKEQRDAFFRDFNQHFNKMITAHELIPGHYVHGKIAARQPHKIRAVFPDPLYVEGWGTFCERLMLDNGWGGPLERLAHYKKQLENIARTIVDIRVHTENMSREEVVRFVKDDAPQGDQLAANMWTRSLTTSPQITTYYLGYRKVRDCYEARDEHVDLRTFMDGMMKLGPVRLEHYLPQHH